MSSVVLILGALSDIGRAIAHEYARRGHVLHLAARRAERLEAELSDLRIRYGVQAHAWEFDALAFDTHEAFYAALDPAPELVFCVFGFYADPEAARQQWPLARQMMEVNYVGATSIMEVAARQMETAGKGCLVGISSVAGDRGRAKNYLYGSSKAAFTAYLSGLRNRLYPKGVHVLTVKPGFVHTQMTAHLDLPPLLTSTPQRVARDVVSAVKKRKNLIYTPWYWRYIMLAIKLIPEWLFKRLSI